MGWEPRRPRCNLQLSLSSRGPRAGHCALPILSLLICKMGIMPASQDGGGSICDKMATSWPSPGCLDGCVACSGYDSPSFPPSQSKPFADDLFIRVPV